MDERENESWIECSENYKSFQYFGEYEHCISNKFMNTIFDVSFFLKIIYHE